MEHSELRAIIEAMIFVAEEPLSENSMLIVLAESGVTREELRSSLEEIEADFNATPARGIGLAKVAGGFQFRTKPSCVEWLRKINLPKPMRLSAPALETLAIVAYRQPIMRSEVENIRGVDSGGVLKTLLDRRLLRIVGRSQEPGQPLLYGTTKEFLELFSLNSLTELPTLKDIDELMRERRAAQAAGSGVSAAEPLTVDNEANETTLEEDESGFIKRRPLDENEEEEGKDMDALDDLEGRLKDVRKLERSIFPKPLPEATDQNAGTIEGGQGEAIPEAFAPEGRELAGQESEEGAAADHISAGEDPAPADDRAGD